MKNLLLTLITLLSFPLLGNESTISGTVIDTESGEPLPFATIAVLGKPRGTVSNIEGKFVLDRRMITHGDSLAVSYVGYETIKIDASEIGTSWNVQMKKSTINLDEIKIYSKNLSAKDLLELVRENYEENHPKPSQRQKVFLHKYEKVPFNAAEQINIKASDFESLSKEKLERFFDLMPEEFVEYHDAVLDFYHLEDDQKVIPVEAVSMEEGSQQDLFKEMEGLFSDFADDILETNENEDVYYRFRTGIFAGKFANGEEMDSTEMEESYDSLYYTVGADYVKNEVLFTLNQYANMESKNWEFIEKTGRYKYTLGDMTNYGEEVVYPISFVPKGKGLFEGTAYISASNYAILQLDFAYAEGKRSEHIQLLGFGHDMNYKRGQVIFERTEKGYFPKYIYAQQKESASINRNFVIKKKEKRFLFDKELNEMKFETDLYFDINAYWEFLVLNREDLTEEDFEKVEQPDKIKFTKQLVYSSEMWENGTVIAPSKELGEFKRSQN